MDEFTAIATLISAIMASETEIVFNYALVSEKALGMPHDQRDEVALMLLNSGFIKGLETREVIGGTPCILWALSKPAMTQAGYRYLDGSAPLKEAFKKLWAAAITKAAMIIENEAVRITEQHYKD